jgi:methylenetetrahydrofolate reductase (NADPH)
MKSDSKLASKLGSSDFIITAECLPPAGTASSVIEGYSGALKSNITAVNVADNHYGVAMSSLAASLALQRLGIEPVMQMVTRDRNRIALQSDLLGAYSLCIRNVLCLTGYHQTLIGAPESANVFDIDSIQLISIVKKMNEGHLLDGKNIEGPFTMLVGAAANPSLKPLELNLMRLRKKIAAGADFIQTQAVFDVSLFQQWLEVARKEGLAGKTAILAGVMPLTGVAEARRLSEKYTDLNIPNEIVERLGKAGTEEAQKKEGINICSEIIKKLKGIPGLRGLHILSGGNEAAVPQLISASGI